MLLAEVTWEKVTAAFICLDHQLTGFVSFRNQLATEKLPATLHESILIACSRWWTLKQLAAAELITIPTSFSHELVKQF